MGLYVMSIPGWRPALDNELFRVHWTKRRLRKRRDASTLANAALVYGVPRAEGRRRVSVVISGRYHRGAVPDDPAPLKSLLDGLTTTGLIVDDAREWLDLVWPPEYVAGPKATVITLEDIES